ncbi:hypothetical protein QE357_002992 [Siphonobacter sp. BAB-5404]|nr:hypothetical protein [Siphonobacter sp. SORGH_AS_0500]
MFFVALGALVTVLMVAGLYVDFSKILRKKGGKK